MRSNTVSRRDFLKLALSMMTMASIPPGLLPDTLSLRYWPTLDLPALPARPAAILGLMPNLVVTSDGRTLLYDQKRGEMGYAPLTPTAWNQTHNRPHHRLLPNKRWGIVLHWYGDKESYDQSIKGYLRGFNSIREIEGVPIQTSAHYLVTPQLPAIEISEEDEVPGIIQMQAADPLDGTPYLASHILRLDYEVHKAKKQYFVRALYTLQQNNPQARSLLQEMYDGPRVDPNEHTLAIEMAGYNFDHAGTIPSDQQIANAVAVIWALMRRYVIQACDVLGHHEINLGKPDPGKKMMALVRYLLGVKALIDPDPLMKELVFGPFLDQSNSPEEAILAYFHWVRDYLVLVSTPHSVFDWEAASQFWWLTDLLTASNERLPGVSELSLPAPVQLAPLGNAFLNPGAHPGLDLYLPRAAHLMPRVNLIATGRCLFRGETHGQCGGKTAVFRHRQVDGSEFISIYSHLESLERLQVGQIYPTGTPIGLAASAYPTSDPYVHLGIAYSAAWELDLHAGIHPPLNAGQAWVEQRFLNPLTFLQARINLTDPILPGDTGVIPGVTLSE